METLLPIIVQVITGIISGQAVGAALKQAAMTQLPVFGVPVNSHFGGMDSVASIAQMPPGVPVMTCGAGREGDIGAFLRAYNTNRTNRGSMQSVNFVIKNKDIEKHPDFTAEVEKARKLAAEKGLEVMVSASAAPDAFNVVMVTAANEIEPSAFCLHVPFMPKAEAAKPENYLKVMGLMSRGGLWVGVNNLRNAVQSAVRLKAGAKA